MARRVTSQASPSDMELKSKLLSLLSRPGVRTLIPVTGYVVSDGHSLIIAVERACPTASMFIGLKAVIRIVDYDISFVAKLTRVGRYPLTIYIPRVLSHYFLDDWKSRKTLTILIEPLVTPTQQGQGEVGRK